MDFGDAQNQPKSSTTAVVGHNRARFDSTASLAQRKWRRPCDSCDTSSVARSKCDALGVSSNLNTVRLLCSNACFYLYASSPSHTCSNDHHLRLLSCDLRTDSVVCQSQPGLLVQRTRAEHRIWPLHQSPSFCGLHGINNCVAAWIAIR